ncbi:MAG: OmpH family outer membrane protein, partial [Paludibacteraceae bacterium]|nr:OmpH family outer membrane protein [Paludibacteraceae bacterium]
MNPKFLLGSNIVLFVAVVILFVLHLKCENPACCGGAVVSNGDSVKTEQFKVAYVQVDSLLANYQFAKQANESLLKKTESSRAQLQRRMQEWQRDAAEFQNKLQNNAFLSRDRAEAENNRLLKKRQELEQLDERLTKELLQEQQKLNEQLKDTVNI